VRRAHNAGVAENCGELDDGREAPRDPGDAREAPCDPGGGRGGEPPLDPGGGPPCHPGGQRHSRSSGTGESDKTHDGEKVRKPRPSRRIECDVDRKVAALASRQQAAVAHDQLIAAGLTDRAIQNWIARGRLFPRHRGVYILGHEALPKYSEEMAAVLACRPKALIGHHSAAFMWGFRPRPTERAIDVTVIGRQARSRAGIRVHRAAAVMKSDLRFIDNVPVVSPALALLQVAAELNEDELELALHEALALKRVTIQQLRLVLKRYPGRRGSAALAALLAPAPTIADSAATKRLARHLKRSGLPPALADHPIGRWRTDFHWPEVALVVEVDGFDFHSSRPRIERDHRKDVELRALGNEVLRFTGRQVHRDIEFVLVAIARAYERRWLATQARAA
jgi:very-short-patch-repair endonuclease